MGATTSQDALAGYSNYGDCVDILAPGSGIRAAVTYAGSNDYSTASFSGTSMAMPHVAGAVAQVGDVTPA